MDKNKALPLITDVVIEQPYFDSGLGNLPGACSSDWCYCQVLQRDADLVILERDYVAREQVKPLVDAFCKLQELEPKGEAMNQQLIVLGLCDHDDREGWCYACGKPVSQDYGCGECGGGVAFSAHCLTCGAIQYAPGGEWEP